MLASLGVPGAARLGSGAEANVYALDERRVARVHRKGVRRLHVEDRASLLAELARGAEAVPFAVPEVLGVQFIAERWVSIEIRLPGRPLSQVLEEASGGQRSDLVRAYLEAAARIGNLRLSRQWFGELLNRRPIRAPSFREYLRKRAEKSLAAAGPGFAAVDPAQLAGALPEPSSPSLVHLDAFPENMLAEGAVVTAVLDFGPTSIMGDRNLDPLTAAAYLDPPISAYATDSDRRTATEWLAEHDILHLYAPARRWLGAYWSGARENPGLSAWSRNLLCEELPLSP